MQASGFHMVNRSCCGLVDFNIAQSCRCIRILRNFNSEQGGNMFLRKLRQGSITIEWNILQKSAMVTHAFGCINVVKILQGSFPVHSTHYVDRHHNADRKKHAVRFLGNSFVK
jgi:hypothetical protein